MLCELGRGEDSSAVDRRHASSTLYKPALSGNWVHFGKARRQPLLPIREGCRSTTLDSNQRTPFGRYKLLSGFGRCQPVSNNWGVLAGF
jgi:hypothetical protein